MSYKFNIFTGTFDDVGSSTAAAVPTYANLAAFPGSAVDGSLAVALDTDLVYVYDSDSSSWKLVNPTGVVKVAAYDNATTSVTSGAATVDPFVVDNITITDGMLVLFSNLSVGNNEVYKAAINAGTIVWTAQNVFTGLVTPVIGDQVVVQQGDGFAKQVGEFDGSTWLFNQTVRYFNGSDYSQQDAIVTSTLTDNTAAGTIFSVAYAGSENMIIEYSLKRGSVKEAGTLAVTTDGTDVAISSNSSATQDMGVSFSGSISGSDILIQYTTTSTGSDATMKYVVKRWSDSAGGPGGIPTYTSGGGSSPAAGSSGDIQFNSAGSLGANANFSYDSINNILLLGALEMSALRTVNLNDNQVSEAVVFTSDPIYEAMVVEYGIIRDTNFRTGKFLMATDGTTVSFFDDYVEQGSTGVVFSAIFSGGEVRIRYTSTSTGVAPVFKYSFRRWSA